MHVVN